MLAAAVVLLAHPILNLWPNGNPGGWHRNDQEEIVHQPGESFAVVRSVSKPTVEFFIAPKAKPDAPLILVCPGGGYWVEAFEHEGTEIAERLNQNGFHAAVLKYRLPNRDADKPLHLAPLQDAQRAICLIRTQGAKYGFTGKRVGIMGFSAGGHLAAVTSTTAEPTYPPVDASDKAAVRPDFAVLLYPAYLDSEKPAVPSPELKVDANTPPTFIVQTMDDFIPISGAFGYAMACKSAQVPVEMHVFPKGGHGYGLRSQEAGLKTWPDLLIAWLRR